MSTALVLHPDGTIIEVSLRPGVSHLALKREHLGCRVVYCLALTDRLDMWLDEEGADTQPVNLPASVLARNFGHARTCHGPALLCSVDSRGASTDLDRGQLLALLARLADAAESI
jgi:Domain of unknown function (DUF3846)